MADPVQTQTPTQIDAAPAAATDAPAAAAPATLEAAAPADPAPVAQVQGLGTPEADADAAPVTEAAAEGVPDAYALTAPEGMTIEPEMLALADPVFKDLGLTNTAAEKLMPVAAEFAKRVQASQAAANEAQLVAIKADWANQSANDPEFGGTDAKYTTSLAQAADALERLGFPVGSPFRVLLSESGLGNHPEMIRAFVRVGQAVGEETIFPRPNTSPPAKVDVAHAMYPDDKPRS